jgi:hypothetical protein
MMRRSLVFRRWSLIALVLGAVAAACTENVETGAGCPMLCPGQELEIIDTLIEPAYVFDSTFVGYPLQGLDAGLLLADRGDTLDVRAVIRFDTLPKKYLPSDGDTAVQITHIDSAYLSFRMREGRLPFNYRLRIEAYDVTDTTLADTAMAALVPLFDVGRLLGTVQFDTATFTDSLRVKIPLDSAKIREIVGTPGRKLRIGLMVVADSGGEIVITPENSGSDGPALEYRFHPDTAYDIVSGIQPSSTTPVTPVFIARDYTDYSLVVDAPDITQVGTFAFGGLPGARAYLRFNLPTWLTDSVGVLRARLELTQDPIYGIAEDDTVRMFTHLVLAGHSVTELPRALTLLTGGGIYAPTLSRVQSDSGIVYLEMGTLLRQWQTFGQASRLPSAIVFRVDGEGTGPQGLRFFGASHANAALRPKLRVSYTPSIAFGRP